MESQDQQQSNATKNHVLLVSVSDDGVSILQEAIHTESLSEGEGGSAEAPESTMLPEEVLQIIYKCVLDDSPQSEALNWRLVSLGWKNAFDNYPILMDNFWWTVSSIPEFLNSTIASKVQNLRFVCGLSADQEQMDKFFKEIIPNVKGIMFDFPEESAEIDYVAQGMLFTNLMSFAKNLEEIKVKSLNREFLRAVLNPEQIELAGCKIKNLFLNCEHLIESEIPILKQFLFGLPKLCKIVVQISSHWHQLFYRFVFEPVEALIKNVILPYIQTSPATLKEILFQNKLPCELQDELALATLKYNLDIDFGKQIFNLNSVFQKAEEANVEVNERSCQSLKNCGLILRGLPNPEPEIALDKFSFCSKLRKLEIEIVNGVLDNNELHFLTSELKHLSTLRLEDPWHGGSARIPNPDSMFLAGIPNLRRLIIEGGIFNSYANFGVYFPNLVRLELRNVINIPADIFVSLGQMEKLNDLDIEDCQVADQMFTAPCQAENGTTIPAIAAIKNLRSLKLTIFAVNHLTDICLIDGISHSPTLEYLTLVLVSSHRATAPDLQFSDAGLNAIKATGRIKLAVSCC